jgi:hypothetical protein
VTQVESTPGTEPADSTADTAEQPAQDFLVFLASTNRGRTVTELTEALRGLVMAVGETGKPGSVTYKLTIRPIDPNEPRGAVKVIDQIDVKFPTHDRPTSIFFVDEHSNLVRDNPNQPPSLF